MTEPQSPLDRAREFFRKSIQGETQEAPKTGPKVRKGSSEKDAKDPKAAKKKKRTLRSEGRESMEAIVVAFILAFLFRTFEAEAFVIPTGSMAPTLLGRNKETYCPKCGQHIVVGASDEIHQETGNLDPEGGFVDSAFCPNCRYKVSLKGLPVFTGDRILVTKFPYEMGEPDRFDVIVFKYPQDPQTNYIKRLIGLPGEEIQISQGDLYVRKTENGKWQILRKDDPNKQRMLQILVYDNDHPEQGLHEHGWPKRWAPVRQSETEETDRSEVIAGWADDADGWERDYDARSFQLPAEKTSDGDWRWLRYRHLVPDPTDWEMAEKRGGEAALSPWERLQLITDFCGYNAYTTIGGRNMNDEGVGYYWVGDLTLSCRVKVESGEGGELLLELNEGFRQYRCRIDLSTGTATLYYPDARSRDEDDAVILGTADTEVQESGTYDLSFANVDNRLCLWVNDELVDFGVSEDGRSNTAYKAFGGENVRQRPSDRDLIPVGIAAKGASVEVSKLKLERDIYYRGESVNFSRTHENVDEDLEGNPQGYEGPPHSEYHGSPSELLSRLSDPAEWYEQYIKHSEVSVRFDRLGDREFFVLGDNSPRSKDSRLWTPFRPGPSWRGELGQFAERAHSVPREALVGKAFYVYWPHGKPFLNDGRGFPITYHKDPGGKRTDYPSFRFPFYPDFGRMERIR